jgi:ubiquinone/menaquinone biosynthesis C-methylase UbiE
MKRPTDLCARALAVLFVTAFIPGAMAQPGSFTVERIWEALGLHDGLTVCEIGAGDGELSVAAARLVGPNGRVYATELGDGKVKSLRSKVEGSRQPQITVLDGDPLKTNFPEGACDAVFMRNVYHHFGDPAAMDASIAASLRPGGRVAVVDFTPPGKEAPTPAKRGEDGMHGVAPDTVARELAAAGLESIRTEADGQRAFMVVFAKPVR